LYQNMFSYTFEHPLQHAIDKEGKIRNKNLATEVSRCVDKPSDFK